MAHRGQPHAEPVPDPGLSHRSVGTDDQQRDQRRQPLAIRVGCSHADVRPGQAHTLGSTLTYSTSTGTFGVDRLYWDELLRLHHTPDFETDYEYTLDHQTTDTIDQTLQRTTAEFRHHLYKSLVTHGEVGYLQLDTGDNGGTKDYFAELDFQYVKNIPYGRLNGTLDLGYNYRTVDSNSQAIQVINQSFTFVDFQPIFIPGQTLEPASIVIRDTSGLILTPGIDYTVDTSRPDGVQIRPVIGGPIDSGETVSVDYTLGPTPDTNFARVSFRSPCAMTYWKGCCRASARTCGSPRSSNRSMAAAVWYSRIQSGDYVAGVEYRFHDLTLTTEYEIYDSTLVPFNAYRATARYDHRASYDLLLTGYASYVRTDYTDLGEKNTTINANAAIT